MAGYSYKKLWKLLIDRDMKKKDLQRLAGISNSSIAKLSKNETVSNTVLNKICAALNCNIIGLSICFQDVGECP